MKLLKYIVSVIAVLACVISASGQSVDVKTNPSWIQLQENKITSDSIVVGDQVVWNLKFTVPQEKEVVFAPYAPVIASYQNKELQGEETLYDNASKICVVHEFVIDTLQISNGVKHLNAKVLVTSFDSGYFKLPQPLAVTKDGDTLYFETPSLEVTNVQVDTANFKVRPLKKQMTYPVTFSEVYPWVLLALLFIVAVYLVYRYVKYRKENRDFFGKPIVKDPPHIIALRELESIRNQKLWQNGKDKQYYTAITDTLREYIDSRYGVNAMEKTSAEIIDSLKDKQIDKDAFEQLDELFQSSDLVKFAKFSPSVEQNEQAILVAVRFVNTTFMDQMQQEKQEEK